MIGNKCRKTYEEMKAKRLVHPFAHSGYKLKEVATGLQRSKDNVKSIAKFKNGKSNGYDMTCCTAADICIYLRKAPENITEDLGFNVFYGIDGLKGDGVSSATIDFLKKRYIPRIETLIDECDRVSHLIRTNINYEYDNFKRDDSEIYELLDEALSIINGILADAGIPRL